MREVLDDILDECNLQLPQFNSFLLKDFREQQINKCTDFMKMTFEEVTRLFQGKVQFKGARILSPEERIAVTINNPRYPTAVEISQTELMLVEFLFQYEQSPFSVHLYMPYIKDDCMLINGTKYFVQFPLTDRIFYHISKDNGLGIKVLRAHLRFWRNLRHQFSSMAGNRYGDNVIIVKIHLRNHKYTLDDIKTALLLYPLCMLGWTETLRRYGIHSDEIQFTGVWNKEDYDYDYFQVRKPEGDKEGLYMKVHKRILSANPDESIRVQMRVVTSLLYVLQYFVRCPSTMYQDNVELRRYLTSDTDTTVWKVILGKTSYGIHYASEIQVCGHAEQHLDSLKTYLDPHTKMKLREIGVYCDNIHELLDYVFINMDSHVVNYTPADLFNKRINIHDLLSNPVVRRIFTKVYGFTNNNRKNRVTTVKDIENNFKIGSKAFTQLHQAGAAVAINPATYNDNYLLTIGARKVRTTHSSTGVKSNEIGGAKTKQQTNHLTSPAHRFHSSWMYVEACLVVSHTNPDIAGLINHFLDIDTKGNVIVSDYAQEYHEQIAKWLITK